MLLLTLRLDHVVDSDTLNAYNKIRSTTVRNTLFRFFRRYFQAELQVMSRIVSETRVGINRLERAMMAATPGSGSVAQPPYGMGGHGWNAAVFHGGTVRCMWLHYHGPLDLDTIVEYLTLGGIAHRDAVLLEDGAIQVTLLLSEEVQRAYNSMLNNTLRPE